MAKLLCPFATTLSSFLTKRTIQKVFVIPCMGKHKIWTAEDCIPPQTFDDVESKETSRLPLVPPGPLTIPQDRKRKMYVIRGPCIGEEAEMIHKQYAIMALKGGLLKPCHFDVMRNKMNYCGKIQKAMWAEYRVKPPYKPVTKHPKNATMGGGKGKIDYYVTPVKARQIILEVGGKVTFEQVHRIMSTLAAQLPFPAIALTYEMLQAMYDEERRLEEENENFFTFRELALKNMNGCRRSLTMYDLQQFGKYK